MWKKVFSRLTRSLLVVSMCVMQTSCLSIFGSPEVIVYEHPKGAEGQRCVEQCVYERNNCLRGCDKRKQECQLQESREGVVKDIVGIVKDMTKIGSGSRIERRESECFRKRETCYVGCAGDGFCKSRCEVEYDCSSTSVGLELKMGDLRRNICNTNRCDYLCKDDYATCFVGCGGKIYKETANPR
ncbi:hypothetical protein [Anaplasma phagocytophilum]|nr:hypothetical protein [Anaplasma phagocytophilum]